MARPVFIATTLTGRTTYIASPTQIDISSFGLNGRRDLLLPLAWLKPDYERVERHRPLLAVTTLSICALFVWAMFKIGEAGEPLSQIVHLVAPLLAGPLAVGLRALFPYVWYEFRDRNGHVRFAVIREPFQTKACDAFVAQLQVSIELARGSLPDENRDEYLAQLELPDAPPPQHVWKLSVGAGVASAVLPWAGDFARDAGGALIVMALSFAGMTLAAVSFHQKERLRWLALLGAACSLVPAFLF